MIDFGAFTFNRVSDLVIGLFLSFLVSVLIAIYIYILAEDKEEFKNSVVKLLVTLTIFIGIIIGFILFFGEISLISYIDMIHGGLIIIFFILLILLVFILSKFANIYGKGMKLSNLRIMESIPKITGPIIAALFFIFIFILVLFDDLSFLFILIFPLFFILFIGLLVYLLVNKQSRKRLVLIARNGTPALFIGLFVIGSLVTIIGYLSFIQAPIFAPVDQANYFNSFIDTSTEDLFIKSIRDDQVRLVDKELAEAIVNRNAAEFGSNIKARSIHITTYKDRLVWVAAMAPDNIFNQELTGLFIIDANDPEKKPIKIEFSAGEATISENLFYGAQTKRVAWKQDPLSSFGRTYITWNDVDNDGEDNKDIVQIQTFNNPQLFKWVTTYGGVKVYNLQGKLIETYTDPSAIPSWISQPFDEDWLESNIDNWGNLRQKSGFDILAPGFLGLKIPSADRLEISRDTRYILSPDTNETVAITPVHPSTNVLSNAGLFMSTNNKITYFDYRQRGYVSSEAIEQFVEGEELPPAQGEYYATLPMLYKLNISSSESRMVWYTPVYYKTGSYVDDVFYTENINFHALYILDATNEKIFGRAESEGNTAQMITSAKNQYLSKLIKLGIGGDEPIYDTEFVTVNITDKASYVSNGTSYIAFKTNNSQFSVILASPENLKISEWLYALFDVEIGTIIKFTAIRENNSWVITQLQSG